MNTDLLRQRRNLMGISSGLLIFEFAEVSVSKISILGTELLIGDVRALVFITWTLWIYFFARYYQYLRAEGNLGISSSLWQRFEWKAKSYILFSILKTDQFTGDIKIENTGFRWKYTAAIYDPSIGSPRPVNTGKLPIFKTTWWWVQSWFHLFMQTPKATDHILPFVLAIAALSVSILRAFE